MFLGYWTDFSKKNAESPLYITVCGSVIQTESTQPLGNPAYFFLLTMKGMGKYETAEKSVILTPGRAILIPPHISVYLRPLTKNWQISYIIFNGSEAQEILAGVEIGAYTAKNAEDIHSTIIKIATLPKESRQTQGRKMLRDLLLSEKEFFSKTKIPLEKKENESALYRAVFYINEHFSERITLSDLAHITGLHKDTVNLLFRRRFGITPIGYVMQTRYEAAEEMLKSSPELSVAEIAKQCGFNSLSYFCRRFPDSVSPREFRRKYKNIDYFEKKPR